MGRRGPKPQPGAVKEQKEAVRSKRVRRTVYKSGAIIGAASEAPGWLKGDGLAIWERLGPTLRAMKLLSDADAATFARYCRNFARWVDLQKRLDSNGDIYELETASGRVRRADPAFLMADRLERMLLAAEDRFGLNPAERQRIFAARAQTSGDLFTPPAPAPQNREGDPAAHPAEPAAPDLSDVPVGFLN